MAQKLKAIGKGNQWDDSSDHDNVTKILVQGGREGIQYIKFDYVKSGEPQTGPIRGLAGRGGFTQTFEIDPKDEHLVSVEVYHSDAYGMIQGLEFKTNKKTSEMIGYNDKGIKPYSLEVNGKKIVGFHGYAETNLNSLGAHFLPLTPLAEKLPPVGGDEVGESWDDGAFNGVREIHVGTSQRGITSLKFVYDKDSQVNEEKVHGEPTRLGYEEFKLDYPSEYITEVKGFWNKTFENKGGVITRLEFKTNNNKTFIPPVGLESGTSFSLVGKEGYKIVGFYGNIADDLHQLGAYVVPITQ